MTVVGVIISAILLFVQSSYARLFDQQIRGAHPPDNSYEDSHGQQVPAHQFQGKILRPNGKFPTHFDRIPITYFPNTPKTSETFDGIKMFDFSKVTSIVVSILEGTLHLITQVCQSVQKLLFFSRSLEEDNASKRKSTLWISWILTATIGIVISVVIKRLFFCPSPRKCGNVAKSVGTKNTGGLITRRTSRKFVTFMKELTQVRDSFRRNRTNLNVREFPNIPKESKVYPGDSKYESKVVTRWFNRVLSNIYSDSSGEGLAVFILQNWITSLNEVVGKNIANTRMKIDFKEIPAMTKPLLRNAFATNIEAYPVMTADFSISILHIRCSIRNLDDITAPKVFDLEATNFEAVLGVNLLKETIRANFSECQTPNFVVRVNPVHDHEIDHSEIADEEQDFIKNSFLEALNEVQLVIPLRVAHVPSLINQENPVIAQPCIPFPSPKTFVILRNLKLTFSNSIVDCYFTLCIESSLRQMFESWTVDKCDQEYHELTWFESYKFAIDESVCSKLEISLWDENSSRKLTKFEFCVSEFSYPNCQNHTLHSKLTTGQEILLTFQTSFESENANKSDSSKPQAAAEDSNKTCEKKYFSSNGGTNLESIKYSYLNTDLRGNSKAINTDVSDVALREIFKRINKEVKKPFVPLKTYMLIRLQKKAEKLMEEEITESPTGLEVKKNLLSEEKNQSDDDDSSSSNSDEIETTLSGWRGKLSRSWDSVASAHLAVPQNHGFDDASSMSEMSTVSNFNIPGMDHSHTILEVSEHSGLVTRYYHIPSHLLKKIGKAKRKGTKLHYFHDHLFLAKHLKSALLCGVCNKKIYKRLGKQGYECRNCDLVCHKYCHTKVDKFCPNRTLSEMELKYTMQGIVCLNKEEINLYNI